MNRAVGVTSSKAGAWSRLVALLAGEALLFLLFLWLASTPDRRIEFADLGAWFDGTAPLDVLVAVAIFIGTLASFWLFASTFVYMGARLARLTQVEDGLRRVTLPAVRRVIDGALAVSIAGTAVLGGGRLAAAASVDRPAVEQAVTASPSNPPVRIVYQQVGDEGPTAAGDVGAPTPAGDPDVQSPSGSGEVLVRPSAPSEPTTPNPDAGTQPGTDVLPQPGGDGDFPQPAGDGTTTTEPAPGPQPAPGPEPAPSPEPAPAPQPAPAEPSVAGEVLIRPGTPGSVGPNVGPGGTTAQIPGAQIPEVDAAASAGAPSSAAGSYTVQPGDNFWTIAAAQVQAKLGRTPTNAEVAAYWEVLIEANRANISSGNPSLIYPGEQFTLPPVA